MRLQFEWVFVHGSHVTYNPDPGWEFAGFIVNGCLIGVTKSD